MSDTERAANGAEREAADTRRRVETYRQPVSHWWWLRKR
jgi:hypothetical protein